MTKNREDEIGQCFTYTNVDFPYPNDVKELNLFIETFQKEIYDENKNVDSDCKISGDSCNIFGENKKFDRLIVMDDVSSLADKSKNFVNFLTVSRKFGYICLYIFHIIYPTKSIWQMILSQTKIFNIFPSTIQLGNILKTLTNNCDRDTINYISTRDLWLNQLYLSLSNESKYSCLAIDCRKSSPAKYRIEANSNFEQFCYYGQSKKDRLFDKSLAKKVVQNQNSLVFQIDSVINVENKK